MAQQISANFFTFSDDSGTTQINYYPQAPGPLVQGQPAGGSRLEYQGPEGHFVYPHAGPGRENVNVQEDDNLGPQITVVLMPSLDAGSVLLTLLLPPINMAGQNEQDFDTIAIKTTRYGILPRAGARITYEAVNLHGVAKHIILPLVAQQ